ncbi:MAG: hypothetical protein J5507_01970 [Clostridia bacterium]|nr:hypothetical protein [Clostridia bacterium]
MNNYKKKLFLNLTILVILVLYFCLLNFMFVHFGIEKFVEIYKQISIGILFISIIIFEIAYNKDNGTTAIIGIELLVLSIITLISINMSKKINITFLQYINFSCVIYLIYYIFKLIILYTKERRIYLKSLSDIQEIVNAEPLKKEAKRKNTD